jgi:hypothetical protein
MRRNAWEENGNTEGNEKKERDSIVKERLAEGKGEIKFKH